MIHLTFQHNISLTQDYAAENGDADVPEKYDGDKELGKLESLHAEDVRQVLNFLLTLSSRMLYHSFLF